MQDLRAWLVRLRPRSAGDRRRRHLQARQTRGGALYALELIAGETVKPLLDLPGRPPRPPAPAYQQFLYGMPAGDYTLDQLDYIRETSRSDSPYGVILRAILHHEIAAKVHQHIAAKVHRLADWLSGYACKQMAFL